MKNLFYFLLSFTLFTSCIEIPEVNNLDLINNDVIVNNSKYISDKNCYIADTIKNDTIYTLEYKKQYSSDIVFTYPKQKVSKEEYEAAIVKNNYVSYKPERFNNLHRETTFKLKDGTGFTVIGKYYNGCNPYGCQEYYDNYDEYYEESSHRCQTNYYVIVEFYEFSLNVKVERILQVNSATYDVININTVYKSIGVLYY